MREQTISQILDKEKIALFSVEGSFKTSKGNSMSKMKVLVAEDVASYHSLWKVALESRGFEPVIVGDGMQALRMLVGEHANQIRVLVTDLSMPNMNGLELIRQILVRRKMLLPVYLYTAHPLGEAPLTVQTFQRLTVQGVSVWHKGTTNILSLVDEIKKNILG